MTGSSKQTTQTNSQPWADAQPALKQGISEAQKLYGNGTGAQVYGGATSVPWSSETQNSMQDLANTAKSNMNGAGLSGQLQGVINNGGLNNTQLGALSGFQGVVGSGGYNAAQLNALDNTKQLANGSFNINDDPGFKQVVDQATNSVNGNASAAGRYGSGTNQQLLGSTIGDLGARQYQAFQTRKDAANQNMFNMGQTGQSNVSSALGNVANLGQQGFSNLGTAYQGMQAPATTLGLVGAGIEGQQQNQLNDNLRIFNAQQQNPWDNLSRLNAIASGAGQLGSSATTSQPGSNPFLTALGYGATTAGFLGSL